jgi:plastocyanin
MRPISRASFALSLGLFIAACSYGAGASPAPSSAPSAASTAAAAPCAGSTEAAAIEVTIEGFTYGPGTVTAKVGQVIRWTNQDGAPHSASLDSGACGTRNLGKGESAGLVFSESGTYPYHCAVHGSSMSGTITIEP